MRIQETRGRLVRSGGRRSGGSSWGTCSFRRRWCCGWWWRWCAPSRHRTLPRLPLLQWNRRFTAAVSGRTRKARATRKCVSKGRVTRSAHFSHKEGRSSCLTGVVSQGDGHGSTLHSCGAGALGGVGGSARPASQPAVQAERSHPVTGSQQAGPRGKPRGSFFARLARDAHGGAPGGVYVAPHVLRETPSRDDSA